MEEFKNKKARELFRASLKIDKEIKENEKNKEKISKSKKAKKEVLEEWKIKDMKEESALLKTLAKGIEDGSFDEDEIQI